MLKIEDGLSKKDIKNIKEEMISKVDKELVYQLFEVAVEGFNSSKCEERVLHKDAVDIYLKQWAKQKWKIYLLFGRELLLRRETKFRVDNDFKEQIGKLLNVEHIERRVNGEKIQVDTSHFVYYLPIIQLFDENYIVDNICPKDDVIAELFGDLYKPGQKLSRFFSRFFDDENFDIQYSKIFQNKFNDQWINLSIDPVDYLTCGMSNNFSGSCYHIRKFYQGAGFSFMCDKSSVVAFMSKSNKETNYDTGLLFYNKINRIIVDFRPDFQQFSFVGNVVQSSLKQIPEYMEWIKELLKKVEEHKGELQFIKSSVMMKRNLRFNHICDNPGPQYLNSGSERTMISPGHTDLFALDNPSTILKITSGPDNGWLFDY